MDEGRALLGIRAIHAIQSGGRAFDNGLREFARADNRKLERSGLASLGRGPGAIPVLYAVDADGVLHLFIAGLQSADWVQAVAAGYVDAVFETRDRRQRLNQLARLSAEELLSRIVPGPADAYTGLRVYGHSFGGIVAEAAAVEWTIRGGTVLSIYTYGAPKPGYDGAVVETPDVERVRLMAFGDAVPLIPFGPLPNQPTLYAVMLYQTSTGRQARWDRMRHGSGGLELRNGFVEPRSDASGSVNPFEQLRRWAEGEAEATSAHSAANYLHQLEILARRTTSTETVPTPRRIAATQPPQQRMIPPFQLATQPPHVGLMMPFPLPMQSLSPGVHPAIVDYAASTITTGNTTRRLQMGVVEMANAKMSPGTGFTRAKIAGRWYVYLQGVQVAEVISGGRARTLCRKGNAFLRYWANLYWQNGDVGNAFQTFTDAAVAGNGYSPPLPVAS